MVEHLEPCPGCGRHVRVSERECPFCGGALDLSGAPEPLLPTARLSRGQIASFRTLVGAGLVGASAAGLSSGCDWAEVRPMYGAVCVPPDCSEQIGGGAGVVGRNGFAGTGADGSAGSGGRAGSGATSGGAAGAGGGSGGVAGTAAGGAAGAGAGGKAGAGGGSGVGGSSGMGGEGGEGLGGEGGLGG